MERVAKERCDSKRSDYVLASIEALKGSSAEVTSLSDHEDASTYALSQAAGRLRGIIALVNSGYLTMEILLQNLEAAARLLEGNKSDMLLNKSNQQHFCSTLCSRIESEWCRLG